MYITPISLNNVNNKINYKGSELKLGERLLPVSLNPVKNATNKILKTITTLSNRFKYPIDTEIQNYTKYVLIPHPSKNIITEAWDINKNGTKKYAIVMHGLSHNISCLQDVYKAIVDNTDYAVLAHEYTDICYPHKNRKTFSDETIIDDSRASIEYLEKKGVKREDIVVVGHSFGGYLASMMAKEFPDIGRLILISPTDSFKHRIYSIENNPNPLISKSVRFFVKHFQLAKNQLGHIYETNKVLQKVKCPIDIIYAFYDNLVKKETVEYLASVSPNLSDLHILNEGSHRMDETKIDEVVKILNMKA